MHLITNDRPRDRWFRVDLYCLERVWMEWLQTQPSQWVSNWAILALFVLGKKIMAFCVFCGLVVVDKVRLPEVALRKEKGKSTASFLFGLRLKAGLATVSVAFSPRTAIWLRETWSKSKQNWIFLTRIRFCIWLDVNWIISLVMVLAARL